MCLCDLMCLWQYGDTPADGWSGNLDLRTIWYVSCSFFSCYCQWHAGECIPYVISFISFHTNTHTHTAGRFLVFSSYCLFAGAHTYLEMLLISCSENSYSLRMSRRLTPHALVAHMLMLSRLISGIPLPNNRQKHDNVFNRLFRLQCGILYGTNISNFEFVI